MWYLYPIFNLKGQIDPKENKIGRERERRVKYFLETRWKCSAYYANSAEDAFHDIDIKAISDSMKAILYIQVKGFHQNWRTEEFPKLLKKSNEDKTKAYVAYVNRNGRIYWRKLN